MNLLVRRLEETKLITIMGVLFIAAVVTSTHAQTAPQLQIEVGPNQQIWITASAASYGDVLRALHEKLGWEIEIPALADEKKISQMHIEAKQPQDALAKLLEGSGLGFALQAAANESHGLKAVVIPSTTSDADKAQDTTPSFAISENGKAGASPPSMQAQSAPAQPDVPAASSAPKRPQPPSTMSLSDAANAIGAPPGVSPLDVGKMTKFAISDAALTVGAPPGVSPNDAGRMTTLPLSDAVKMIGVPPGISPNDVGKTAALPLATGSDKRP